MLPEKYNGYLITEFDELPSTNTYLTDLAKKGAPDGTVVVARRQTSGRGRRGKSFYSPVETGIYMSLILRGDINVGSAKMLTPATAVAVARALEQTSGMEMGIKWVNDIFCNGKKVCGILTECKMNFGADRLDYAVVGIGVNLAEPSGGFPQELSTVAGAVFDSYNEETRNTVILAILDNMSDILNSAKSGEFMDEYRRRSILIGREVEFDLGINVHRIGKAVGISDNGELLVDIGEEILSLDSGEVSVRLQKTANI